MMMILCYYNDLWTTGKPQSEQGIRFDMSLFKGQSFTFKMAITRVLFVQFQ